MPLTPSDSCSVPLWKLAWFIVSVCTQGLPSALSPEGSGNVFAGMAVCPMRVQPLAPACRHSNPSCPVDAPPPPPASEGDECARGG